MPGARALQQQPRLVLPCLFPALFYCLVLCVARLLACSMNVAILRCWLAALCGRAELAATWCVLRLSKVLAMTIQLAAHCMRASWLWLAAWHAVLHVRSADLVLFASVFLCGGWGGCSTDQCPAP
jgi:hypothetical protein